MNGLRVWCCMFDDVAIPCILLARPSPAIQYYGVPRRRSELFYRLKVCQLFLPNTGSISRTEKSTLGRNVHMIR